MKRKYRTTQRENTKYSFDCKLGKNKKMDDAVYALRKNVMKYIYEAKQIIESAGFDFTRQNIRIVERNDENYRTALGCGAMNDNIVWIPDCVAANDPDLRFIVFHELGHSMFGLNHDSKCPLMNAVITRGMDAGSIHKIFLRYVRKNLGGKK